MTSLFRTGHGYEINLSPLFCFVLLCFDFPVNSIEDVRNKLAISSEFKDGNLYKVEFTIKPGVGVREGTAGDMWDASRKIRLPGGANQVNFMDKTRANPEFYNVDVGSLRLLK